MKPNVRTELLFDTLQSSPLNTESLVNFVIMDQVTIYGTNLDAADVITFEILTLTPGDMLGFIGSNFIQRDKLPNIESVTQLMCDQCAENGDKIPVRLTAKNPVVVLDAPQGLIVRAVYAGAGIGLSKVFITAGTETHIISEDMRGCPTVCCTPDPLAWRETGVRRCDLVADNLEALMVNNCGKEDWQVLRPLTWIDSGITRCHNHYVETQQVNDCGTIRWTATTEYCNFEASFNLPCGGLAFRPTDVRDPEANVEVRDCDNVLLGYIYPTPRNGARTEITTECEGLGCCGSGPAVLGYAVDGGKVSSCCTPPVHIIIDKMPGSCGGGAGALTTADTPTVLLTGDGTISTPLRANAKISPDGGNLLTSHVNGLYAGLPPIPPGTLTDVVLASTPLGVLYWAKLCTCEAQPLRFVGESVGGPTMWPIDPYSATVKVYDGVTLLDTITVTNSTLGLIEASTYARPEITVDVYLTAPPTGAIQFPGGYHTVANWGEVNLTHGISLPSANLTSVPNTLPPDAKSMFAMFMTATSFNQDISGWDVSAVTNMGAAFGGASAFNKSLNAWNVSNVTLMDSMFYNASAFNQPLNLWNTASLTSMTGMFAMASAFNQDVSTFNVSGVTSLDSIFAGALAFNRPLNAWNVSNAVSMANIFDGASSFNQSLNAWDVSQVVTANRAFAGATAFNGDITTWVTTSLTNTADMFLNASAFNQGIGVWDMSHVTDMSRMFYHATSFNANIDGWNTSSATTTRSMFEGATAFSGSLAGWDVSNVVDIDGMFNGATSFNGAIGGWDVSSTLLMNSMFASATSFNQDLSNWCVVQFNFQPLFFDTGALAYVLPRPPWGVPC